MKIIIMIFLIIFINLQIYSEDIKIKSSKISLFKPMTEVNEDKDNEKLKAEKNKIIDSTKNEENKKIIENENDLKVENKEVKKEKLIFFNNMVKIEKKEEKKYENIFEKGKSLDEIKKEKEFQEIEKAKKRNKKKIEKTFDENRTFQNEKYKIKYDLNRIDNILKNIKIYKSDKDNYFMEIEAISENYLDKIYGDEKYLKILNKTPYTPLNNINILIIKENNGERNFFSISENKNEESQSGEEIFFENSFKKQSYY